ncbi:MinD/ParA family ATP-binding protein [Couchioplanes caeruleus]|uniref:ATPase n=2 Tax=Couchioplanes caeruleus TaxID=56438 RepID=A0A1K0G7P5_9ACTN|nr:AAA family ATPase [Couchioplanes caeruleus]OJF13266.1 ATPase [Couchioplanes caeruleus subsp. caeruleus]ROP29191.1 MinD-like ATPase involved in chromosome partitioning or flagellar assembly [Couchioplanes caeruleus]
MDGTETGWGRPAEPAPRWRGLLDRARHASRTGDDAEEAEAEGRRPVSGPPLPSRPGRPYNPLDPRMRDQAGREPNGYSPAEPPRRPPINPLDRRPGRAGLGERLGATEPLSPPVDPRLAEPRPAHSLEGRRQSRISEGFHARSDAEPHSFFNPATRAVPPSIGRVAPEPGMPHGRGAIPAGSPSMLRPPAVPPQAAAPPLTAPPQRHPAPHAPAVPPQNQPPHGPGALLGAPLSPAPGALPSGAPAPVSPPAARIEWRQTRPEPEDRAAGVLRRILGKPRVLAFANPKGGVHKTTATVLAAATIGSVRGRGVLAWDDNELRGTLGLRAGSARHARTIRHLVGDLIEIENMHGNDLMQFFDGYLRHASDGSYDVLAGEENPRFAQRLDQSTVRRVMDLLRRTHDVICVDTGNNVESVNWQTVMRSADQLVVTTVPREDAAFTADWMLDVLNETGMEDLVANAVTLISCPSPGKLPLLDDLAKHFATRTRAVAVVPYDPALEVGSSIEYTVLQPETKQAWLRAAAVMIEPFAE